MTIIESGKGVIIKKGKNLKYVYVSGSAKVEKMENFLFSCKDMIGQPFGSAFKVLDKHRLLRIDPVLVETHTQEYENTGIYLLHIFTFMFMNIVYKSYKSPSYFKFYFKLHCYIDRKKIIQAYSELTALFCFLKYIMPIFF